MEKLQSICGIIISTGLIISIISFLIMIIFNLKDPNLAGYLSIISLGLTVIATIIMPPQKI